MPVNSLIRETSERTAIHENISNWATPVILRASFVKTFHSAA